MAGALLGLGAGVLSAIDSAGGNTVFPDFIQTNPFAGIIGGLAGLGAVNQQGGVRLGRVSSPDRGSAFTQRAPTLFTPETLANLNEFIQNPLPFSATEQIGQGALPGLLGGGVNLINEFSNQFTIPAAIEAIQTGFEVDSAPFAEAARNQLFQETVPNLTEQFSGTAGIASSDFGRALARAGRDVELGIGAKQIDLADNAAQRRFGALTAAPAAALSGPSLALALIDAATGLSGRLRGAEEGARPGSRAFDALTTLGGLGSPGNLGTVGSVQESGGGTLGALAAVLGSLSQGFGAGLFDGTNSGLGPNGGGAVFNV